MKKLKRMRGQALIEMAVALPLFLTVIFGVTDLGRAAFTYNGLMNLARESSHYAMLEYSTDASSPCYWASYNSANCLTQVRNYALGLNMVPDLYAVNVSIDLVACQGTCTSAEYPITVSMATHFQPVSTTLLGIGPFDISASSTAQFVAPPVGSATPTPTPTTTGAEVAVTGINVNPDEGCHSNCQEFDISWTPPANLNALGHYEISYGTAGNYTYHSPLPPIIDGNATHFMTIDLGNQFHAVCIQVISVYSDGTQAPATGSWNDSGTSAPTC